MLLYCHQTLAVYLNLLLSSYSDMVKHELRVTSHELRVTSYELRVESLKAQVDSFNSWVKIQKCELRV